MPPPYVSVVKLENMIDLLSRRNFTDISVSIFTNYGFSKVDALLSISALRFLGFINEDGHVTDAIAGLRLKGEVQKKEFEKIVREAYKKLFDVVDDPQNLSADELSNEFTLQYGISKRIVKTAKPVFLKLCEYAGLKAEGSIVRSKRTFNTKKKVAVKEKYAGAPPQILDQLNARVGRMGFASIRVAEGRMVLNIPVELKERLLDEEALGEDWKILRTALRVFADKYILDDLSGDENFGT